MKSVYFFLFFLYPLITYTSFETTQPKKPQFQKLLSTEDTLLKAEKRRYEAARQKKENDSTKKENNGSITPNINAHSNAKQP